ncbi:hypothetical protein FI667_g7534, partial [Globisporangium splendens]
MRFHRHRKKINRALQNSGIENPPGDELFFTDVDASFGASSTNREPKAEGTDSLWYAYVLELADGNDDDRPRKLESSQTQNTSPPCASKLSSGEVSRRDVHPSQQIFGFSGLPHASH